MLLYSYKEDYINYPQLTLQYRSISHRTWDLNTAHFHQEYFFDLRVKQFEPMKTEQKFHFSCFFSFVLCQHSSSPLYYDYFLSSILIMSCVGSHPSVVTHNCILLHITQYRLVESMSDDVPSQESRQSIGRGGKQSACH